MTRTIESMCPHNFAKAASLTARLIAAAGSFALFNAVPSPLRAELAPAAPATPASEADFVHFYQNPSPARLNRLITYFNTVAESGKLFIQPPMIG
ncbi:MAG: hypothetical protein ACRD3S_17825, partial [Terracidiphilus sp.]